MSSIPTKQIDGDVAVSRNVTTGGNATVRGSMTVNHGLRVEGWLDAPNIKGPSKGLFKTQEKLQESYPLPENGWWAMVGTKLPFTLVAALNGLWEAIGEVSEINVDSEQIEDLYGKITALEGSKGAPNGIAPLGADGKVPKGYLPLGDVIEFYSFVAEPQIEAGDTEFKPHSGNVVFDTVRNVFLLDVRTTNPYGNVISHKYYDNWLARTLFGTVTEEGVVPEVGKLYVSSYYNAVYRYTGTKMIELGITKDEAQAIINKSLLPEKRAFFKYRRRVESESSAGKVLHRGVMPLYAKPYTYYVCKAGESPKFKLPSGHSKKFWADRAISFSVPRALQGHIAAADYSMPCGRHRNSGDFEIHIDSDIYRPDQSKGHITIITPMNIEFDITPGLVLVTDLMRVNYDRVMFYDKNKCLRFVKRTVQDRFPEPELPHNFIGHLASHPNDTITHSKRGKDRRDSLPTRGFIIYKKKQCGKIGVEGTNGTRFISGDHGYKYQARAPRIVRGVYRVCYVTKKGYRSRCVVVTAGLNAFKRFVVREIKT